MRKLFSAPSPRAATHGPDRRQRRSAEIREKLFRAALKLFGEKGLAETTVKRLCNQRRETIRVGARSYLQLVRPDKFLPIFLDRHCFHPCGQLSR